jgi:hypothetical protein
VSRAVRIAAHGISIELPPGWEGRIFRRGEAGPILHAATFALHAHDGDFGAAATGRMRSDDRFIALIEYRPEGSLRAGHGLFADAGPPRPPHAHEFGPRQLQVTRRGQLGWQRFFSASGRALCLYAVVAPGARSAPELIRELNGVVGTLRLDAGFAGRAQPTG